MYDNNESEILAIDIYPYGRSRESWLDNSFQMAKIKTPSGEVHEVEVFAYKKGTLYWDKKNHPKLLKILSEPGLYKFRVDYMGKYQESTYQFQIEL